MQCNMAVMKRCGGGPTIAERCEALLGLSSWWQHNSHQNSWEALFCMSIVTRRPIWAIPGGRGEGFNRDVGGCDDVVHVGASKKPIHITPVSGCAMRVCKVVFSKEFWAKQCMGSRVSRKDYFIAPNMR